MSQTAKEPKTTDDVGVAKVADGGVTGGELSMLRRGSTMKGKWYGFGRASTIAMLSLVGLVFFVRSMKDGDVERKAECLRVCVIMFMGFYQIAFAILAKQILPSTVLPETCRCIKNGLLCVIVTLDVAFIIFSTMVRLNVIPTDRHVAEGVGIAFKQLTVCPLMVFLIFI